MPLTAYELGGAQPDNAWPTAKTIENEATDPTPTPEQHFAVLPLEVVVASLTNPRKTFDQAKLQELADSIKATGVHQPILVRPLPGSRLQDTFFEVNTLTRRTGPKPTHEIISGERRYRASQLAGMPTIPAMVRHLTDDQMLEIQIIENLQRDDLTPLEEAEGYEHLMQHAGLNADQVAAKIGKSRSYVYARTKLLDLGPQGREALREGKLDASRALLVARIPDGELQAKAVEELTEEDFYGQMPSYRQACDIVQREFMLKLEYAKFPIKDATLVPAAGECKACPKRTGANPDLFADAKGADMCTDPKCYHGKEAAHQARQLAEAQARGQTIITGKEARELMPHSWSTRVEGYLRLDDASDSPTDKPLRTVLAKQLAKADVQPILVANPHKEGDLIAVLPTDKVAELLQAKGDNKAAKKLQGDAEAEANLQVERERAEAKNALEQAWRWAVLEATWQQVHERTQGQTSGPELDRVTRHIATRAADRLNQDDAKKLCKLLALGKVAPKEGLLDWVRNDSTNPGAALLLITMFNECGYHPHLMDYSGKDGNDALWLVAEAFGVDKAAIEAQTRANTRAAQASAPTTAAPAAEATEASPPLHPAAQARSARGGKPKEANRRPPAARGAKQAPDETPKLSAAHALSGIAAAMQKDEAAASTAAADAAGDGAADEHASDVNPGAADASQGDEAAASTAAGEDQGATTNSMANPDLWPFPKGRV
ncbi:ParB/RepB/Spo0J family partition protein [Hydrogenophaga atypica]|uniref:ParB/RepB/Spo0J family partition protein n=1 Tax=Hydrogenophaga atypica TaxID=249409 RepID=A0ABW2QH35_9BURK